MDVRYLDPLRRAWERARRMLFRPFDLGKWFVLGFAAFLSELGERSGYGHYERPHGHVPWNPGEGLAGIFSGVAMAGLIALVLAAVVLFIVLLTWINSRGRFIFLDGVAHERAAIVEPWKRHAALGNSLFAWELGFEVVCACIAVLMALPFLAVLTHLWSEGHFRWEAIGAVWVLLAMVLPFVLAISLVLLVLGDFVVPIMYQQQIGVLAAWSKFLALFRAYPGAFVLYALFVFGLSILVSGALIVVGIGTCCVGFVLFTLPYLSSVVLLPIHVTFRALGPEFLAQFGPEFSVWSAPGGAGGGLPASPAAGAPPPAGGGGE